MEKITLTLDKSGWYKDELHDIVSDLLCDADVDVSYGDVGIGAYEYWGSREVDSRMEIDEVVGKAEFELDFNVLDDLSQEQVNLLKQDILKNLPTIHDYRGLGDDDSCNCVSFEWVPSVKDDVVVYMVEIR